MSKVRLKRLLADKDTAAMVSALDEALQAGATVYDTCDVLLFGTPAEASSTSQKFPIFVHGQEIGCVRGNDHAEQLARFLSKLAVLESDKKTLAREALERYRELTLFYDMAEKIASSTTIEDVGRLVVEEADRIFKPQNITVLVRDDESGMFHTLSRMSKSDDRPLPDLESLHSAELVESEDGVAMRAPLRVKDKVLGMINVSNPLSGVYSAGDLKLLTAMAAQITGPIQSVRQYDRLNAIMQTIEEVNRFNDVDTILDRILFEARKLARADAGSIFLMEDEKLKFSYVHNETLFQEHLTPREVYEEFSIPISEKSIVGYAAMTGRSVAIDDAYELDPSLPYTFNPSYDHKSGYKTTSILAIPLRTHMDRLVGVMQIINAKNESGKYVPFTQEQQTYIPLFAANAAVALERAIMTRERILRMMRLAELRDPKETGAHVQRVGAYSAEIYHRWALNKGLDVAEIRRVKDMIRLAAMLHDVGKVGIPDAILKKPGRLTEAEFLAMKRHTIFGARVFGDATAELDLMCRDIALGHHEKWAGGGYPGSIGDIWCDELSSVESRCGETIPLPARITSLADVYDALSSRRSYKEPWPEERILSMIEAESGSHFDPEIVEAFFQVLDLMSAIRDKYRERVAV